MKGRRRFGETVEGYDVLVLNEREIRASAGILFLVMFSSWMQILFTHNFAPIKYAIVAFLADFIIRVAVDPRYSPSLLLGRFIVRRQDPEYVGAAPKKFAWTIGLTLVSVMFLHLVIANSYSFITGIICLACLVFLFFESAFGICLGCLFYSLFHKEKARHCPGNACDAKAGRNRQKLSPLQWGFIVGFVFLVLLTSILFKARINAKPEDLRTLLASIP